MAATPPPTTEGESVRTVVIALAANLGIALAKLLAALVSRSGAMLAEALHAFADTGNQVLLLVAQRRSGRPPDERHPMGHGREAYFWALIASLGVFATGALLSVHEGIDELMQPSTASSFPLAYAVLLLSFMLESLSLRRAYRQLREEARTLSRAFLEHLDLSSDPIARAVFAEDAAAVVGNLIAGAGIALHQITGSAIPDGIAAIVIGLTLGYVAFQLARRNADFLVGRQASPPIHGRIRQIIASQRGIRAIAELLVTFLGPRRLWVLARVEVDDAITGADLKALVRSTEDALTGESPFITRVDLVLTDRR
jgi:cation diffusion facilitator family transporter